MSINHPQRMITHTENGPDARTALISEALNNLGIHHTRVAAVRIRSVEEEAGHTVASAEEEAGRTVAAEAVAGRIVAAGAEAGRTVAAADMAASAAGEEAGCTASAAGVGAGYTDLGAWIVPDSTSRFGSFHRRVLRNVVGPRELVEFPHERA